MPENFFQLIDMSCKKILLDTDSLIDIIAFMKDKDNDNIYIIIDGITIPFNRSFQDYKKKRQEMASICNQIDITKDYFKMVFNEQMLLKKYLELCHYCEIWESELYTN
jgi:hypothetical protein